MLSCQTFLIPLLNEMGVEPVGWEGYLLVSKADIHLHLLARCNRPFPTAGSFCCLFLPCSTHARDQGVHQREGREGAEH